MSTHNQNWNESSDCRIPISIRTRFANKYRIKYEVTQSEFDTTFFLGNFFNDDCSYIRGVCDGSELRRILVIRLNFRISLLSSNSCGGCPVLIEASSSWKVSLINRQLKYTTIFILTIWGITLPESTASLVRVIGSQISIQNRWWVN